MNRGLTSPVTSCITVGDGSVYGPFGVSDMADIDRSEASRTLAKAIAFKSCGKDIEANEWARKLVRILGAAEILRGES